MKRCYFDDKPSDWYREAYNTGFPRCLPDKNVFAPVMDEGVAKIETTFMQQVNKIERWILRQMDVVRQKVNVFSRWGTMRNFPLFYPNYDIQLDNV